jgi:hypothetical protein
MKSKLDSVKVILTWIARLLSVARYLPFLGKWKEVSIALAALVGGLLALIEKCDANQPSQPPIQSIPTPEPTDPQATPIRTPSPTPPVKAEIIVDRIPEAGWPFTVRYTAKFDYNIFLWADQYKLQVMGQEFKTGFMVAPAVILKNAGPRKLTVRNLQGDILAEKMIEVRR